MEFLDLLYLSIVSIQAIFVNISSIVFLQQWWSLVGQLKKKTVILMPFWAARPTARFAFAESKFQEKDIISKWQQFDLLLAAMPEKILDQVIDPAGQLPAQACGRGFAHASLHCLDPGFTCPVPFCSALSPPFKPR
jgi:hypothetical protein